MGVGAKCQENAGNARGMYGSGFKVPVERTGVGAKCQGNAGKCKGMLGERMEVCLKSQGK